MRSAGLLRSAIMEHDPSPVEPTAPHVDPLITLLTDQQQQDLHTEEVRHNAAMDNAAGRKKHIRWTGIMVNIIVFGILAIAGLMLLPPLVGYKVYVVTGKSMTGTINKGSLAYDKEVPVSSLQVGDIITYMPPSGAQAHQELVTHRIFSISKDKAGQPVFVTKGDANNAHDPWTFTLKQPQQMEYQFHVPLIGWLYSALTIGWVRFVLLALPAFILGFTLLYELWRDAGKNEREEQRHPTSH